MPRYIDFSQKPKEVQYAAHTIGLDNKRPYQRHGKFFYGHTETTSQPMIKHTIIQHGRDCAKEDTLRVVL